MHSGPVSHREETGMVWILTLTLLSLQETQPERDFPLDARERRSVISSFACEDDPDMLSKSSGLYEARAV